MVRVWGDWGEILEKVKEKEKEKENEVKTVATR